MNKIINYLFCTAALAMAACASRSGATLPGLTKPEQHDLEIRQRGVGSISIDQVPNSVLKAGTDSGFVSYRIRFTDSSLTTDPAKSDELNKYYQYTMSKDWVLLAAGDSIRPVYYQPVVKRFAQVNEGIAVFELDPGRAADTIVFLDSKGIWGSHKVSLIEH